MKGNVYFHQVNLVSRITGEGGGAEFSRTWGPGFDLLNGSVSSACQPPRWKHAFYGMFSSGLIPMGYAIYISLGLFQFLSLSCGQLLADLDSSHVLIVIIYSDLRDKNIVDCST